ncbi:MAG TPA: hypothetical protein VF540_12415, partial [Segetibacter sp.]
KILKNYIHSYGANYVFLLQPLSRRIIDNTVTQQATCNFMDPLQSRFGLNVQQAANIANNLIPTVLKRLVQKTSDPADKSFDLQKIFNEVSGGKTGGLNAGRGGVVDKIKGLFK